MEAANIGSAKASIRSISTPSTRISSTGVITPMICGAAIYISAPMIPMTDIPDQTVMLAKRLSNRIRFAPRLCPTSVVAASAMP